MLTKNPVKTIAPVRVVIPAYRADATVFECVQAVQCSTISHRIKVVVVDDSNDGCLQNRFRTNPVSLISKGQNVGAALARNAGAQSAKGLIVFLDSDVIVQPNTIEKLIRPIEDGISEAAVGNYSMDVDGMSYAQKYKQLYISHIYQQRSGYLKNQFWTAIGAIKADVFHQLNGFRCITRHAAGEDTEFGHRLTKAGHRIYSVPDATGVHLKDHTVASILKNDLTKGTTDFALALTNQSKITDHRHAKTTDIASVVFAYCILLTPFLGSITNPIFCLTSLTLFLGTYIFMRRRLVFLFARQGISFLARSCFLMFGLDIVRGICVLFGLARFLSQPRK